MLRNPAGCCGMLQNTRLARSTLTTAAWHASHGCCPDVAGMLPDVAMPTGGALAIVH